MKKFQRNIEDFVCEHCGHEVKGNGYTNHCPHCLWSKHVDINPGDRLENCRGMMNPLQIEFVRSSYIIIHRCIKCGHEKKNITCKDDDFERILEVSSKN
jgi:hypothetical protein